MKCPYCGTEMEKGRISMHAMFNPIRAATLRFVPNNKGIKKKTANQFADNEGWYCSGCRRIIAAFHAN